MFLGDLRPAPTITQRDRDRSLRLLLADDVLVELLNNFFWGHRHGRALAIVVGRRSDSRPPRSPLKLFYSDLVIGVDTDVRGDGKRLLDYAASIQIGVVRQGSGRGLTIGAP